MWMLKEILEDKNHDKQWNLIVAPLSRTPMTKEDGKSLSRSVEKINDDIVSAIKAAQKLVESKDSRIRRFLGPVVSSFSVKLDNGDSSSDPLLAGLKNGG